MRRGPLSGRIRRRPIFGRIDQAARWINPLLVVAAVLLALIDLSCYTAIEIARRHPPRPMSDAPGAVSPAPGQIPAPPTQD
jgi:hypothetical protein